MAGFKSVVTKLINILQNTPNILKPKDSEYDEVLNKMICPVGNQTYIKNSNYQYKGSKAIAYMAIMSD